jgi:hypothetical protein
VSQLRQHKRLRLNQASSAEKISQKSGFVSRDTISFGVLPQVTDLVTVNGNKVVLPKS